MFKTTIVTMFYNLKNLADASNVTRPLEFYVENGKHTLSLAYPMVIFCDEETIDIIKKVRSKVDPAIPTTYIVKKLTDYDFYADNFDIIQENREGVSHYGHAGQRNTSSYFLITMFKSVCLRIAKNRNDYNTPFYAWVDLGCNHVLKNVSEYAPKMLDNPKPKICACYIHYRSKEELANLDEFFRGGGPCGMAATVFTAEASYIDRFYNGMMELFHMQLCKRTGHSDEQTMTLCYDKYPALFTIYNGDYYSILTNYHETTTDLSSIKYNFIYTTMNSKEYDLAKEAIMRVLDSLNSREHSSLSHDELDIKTELTHLYNHRCTDSV